MSKHAAFQRRLLAVAISSLVGAACAEVGSPWTGESYANAGTDAWDSMTVSGTFNNSGTLTVDKSLTVTGSSFTNSGTLQAGTIDIQIQGSANLGGTISAENIIYQNNSYSFPGNSIGNITADNLKIISSEAVTGLTVSSQESVENINKITVHAAGDKGHKTALYIDAGTDKEISIESVDLLHTSIDKEEDARVEVSTGSVRIENLYVSGPKGMIQTNNLASAVIDNIYVDADTKLNLQTNGTPKDGKSDFTIHNVTVAAGGDFRVSVYGSNPGANIKGEDIVLNLHKDAIADFGGWKDAANTDWRSDDITFSANSLTVNVLDADDTYTPSVYLSAKEGNVSITNGIRVVSASSNNTGNVEADLGRLTNVVKLNDKTGSEGTNNVQNYTAGYTVVQLADDLNDGATGFVNGEGKLSNVAVQANPNINGIAGVATLGLHLWRNEMNDVTKRLGDLRAGTGNDVNGVWARIYNGQAKLNGRGVENDYTSLQIGADREVANGVRIGAAFSYTDGNNDIGAGSGDSSVMALTGYATKFFDNGMFVDVTAKYGRIDSDFDILLDNAKSSGDYNTNAFSVSMETGWRFAPTQLVFVEPQLELMYGRIDSVGYTTSTGVHVEQDAADTLVGRAGLVLGVACPNNRGNAYVRASVLHDWQGEAQYSFAKTNAASRHLSDDLGGTWYEFGLGANLHVAENCLIYADAERTSSGEVDTDYRVNLGVRWGF